MFFVTCSQGQIHYCYTGRLLPAGAAYPCRATRKSGVCGQHLRIRRSVQFILAGAVRYNVPKSCAAFPIPVVSPLLQALPLNTLGFGWLIPAAVGLLIGLLLSKKTEKA